MDEHRKLETIVAALAAGVLLTIIGIFYLVDYFSRRAEMQSEETSPSTSLTPTPTNDSKIKPTFGPSYFLLTPTQTESGSGTIDDKVESSPTSNTIQPEFPLEQPTKIQAGFLNDPWVYAYSSVGFGGLEGKVKDSTSVNFFYLRIINSKGEIVYTDSKIGLGEARFTWDNEKLAPGRYVAQIGYGPQFLPSNEAGKRDPFVIVAQKKFWVVPIQNVTHAGEKILDEDYSIDIKEGYLVIKDNILSRLSLIIYRLYDKDGKILYEGGPTIFSGSQKIPMPPSTFRVEVAATSHGKVYPDEKYTPSDVPTTVILAINNRK